MAFDWDSKLYHTGNRQLYDKVYKLKLKLKKTVYVMDKHVNTMYKLMAIFMNQLS